MLIKRNKDLDITNIMSKIYNKDRIIRSVEFLIGIFIVAIAYNVILLPSNITYGIGGLGVILKKLFNFDPSIVILIGSLLLLILSFLTLGRNKTIHTIAGSLLYPLFIKLTEPFANYVNFDSLEPVVIVIIGAVISGLGLGLVFKAGYTSGGTDILNDIVSKCAKVSVGTSMVIVDGSIILLGLLVFNLPTFIYSIISLYIISTITDKVILGISQSKTFYIITNNETTIKKFLLHNLCHGVTVLNGRGGYTGDNQKVIMCTIPTREYFIVKEGIKQIDPQAFFLVTDAYEVSGGA